MTRAAVEPLPHLTMSAPRRRVEGVEGVVLLLHGLDRSSAPLDNRSPSWLRMRLMLNQIDGPLHRSGLAVWLLRYRFGGWSSETSGGSPVADARWALARIHEAYPDVPVALVGHSMGARTAVAVADDQAVRGVVALAPWFDPADGIQTLTGRRLYAAHGRADRVTAAAATEAYVRRAARVAEVAEFTDFGDRGHYLLAGISRWNAFAVESARRVVA